MRTSLSKFWGDLFISSIVSLQVTDCPVVISPPFQFCFNTAARGIFGYIVPSWVDAPTEHVPPRHHARLRRLCPAEVVRASWFAKGCWSLGSCRCARWTSWSCWLAWRRQERRVVTFAMLKVVNIEYLGVSWWVDLTGSEQRVASPSWR